MLLYIFHNFFIGAQFTAFLFVGLSLGVLTDFTSLCLLFQFIFVSENCAYIFTLHHCLRDNIIMQYVYVCNISAHKYPHTSNFFIGYLSTAQLRSLCNSWLAVCQCILNWLLYMCELMSACQHHSLFCSFCRYVYCRCV